MFQPTQPTTMPTMKEIADLLYSWMLNPWSWVFFALFVLLFILLSFQYYLYKKRKERERLLKEYHQTLSLDEDDDDDDEEESDWKKGREQRTNWF